jgi:hypothetical protein
LRFCKYDPVFAGISCRCFPAQTLKEMPSQVKRALL